MMWHLLGVSDTAAGGNKLFCQTREAQKPANTLETYQILNIGVPAGLPSKIWKSPVAGGAKNTEGLLFYL